MAQISIILALLCFVSCYAEKAETEYRFKDLPLQQDWSWLRSQETRVRPFGSA